MNFSRLACIWLFWPGLLLVLWGELAPSAPSPFEIWDKALHFTAYFGLAAMAWMALGGGRRGLWAVGGLIMLGGLLEMIQGQIGRDMSFYDEVANTLGAISGALIARGYTALLRLRLVEAPDAD